ncbi:MAG TPA: cation diffusion facilitator family transporter [Terriglobales bacterium]|nr:cation diffusion facilitator family transporter [Terriglobales bacterium]
MHAHPHAHGHAHDYSGARPSGPAKARILRFSLMVTLGYIVLLVITGIRSHSLALLSEAAHNVSDFLALLLSLFAVYFEARPPSATKTFGYSRAGVLAAFVNSATLVLIAFYIFYEAFERFKNPQPVHAGTMIWVAAAGVAMNGVITLLLWAAHHDLNMRSVFLHELGDTLSTAAVIAGGWAIIYTGKTWIDSALSFGIGALILWSSFGIVRESLNILLEGTPSGMELDQISVAMGAVAGVRHVHDLHVWTIGSNMHALCAHVTIADIPPSESEKILREVKELLLAHFHIHHTTLQFEHEVCDVAHGCVIPVNDTSKDQRA